MRKFRGYVIVLKEKTRMRIFEEMAKETAKVYLRIQERQVHAGKRNFIE